MNFESKRKIVHTRKWDWKCRLHNGGHFISKCHEISWPVWMTSAGQNDYSDSPITKYISWWRHQMETFSALLVLSAGNSPVTGEFPSQRPLTRSFDVFFDLRLNKELSTQSWGWWFETSLGSLWRHCDVPENMCNSIVNTVHVNDLAPLDARASVGHSLGHLQGWI